MKKLIAFLVFVFGFASLGRAANVFVGPASICSGSASGADWATCKSWDSLSFVGGNTYYLMDGSYAGRGQSNPLTKSSNSSLMTIIKKATPSDLGGGGSLPTAATVTGQATFTSGFTFQSSYWTFDGSKGSMSENPNDYGFKFTDGQTNQFFFSTVDGKFTDIYIYHIAAKAPTSDQEKPFLHVYTQVGQLKNATVSNCLLNGYQSAMFSRGQGSLSNDSWTFERNVCLNGYSRNAGSIQFHGEWINADGKSLTNLVVKYNLFKLADGAMTGTINANNSTIDGAIIYGNVFDRVSVTNGIIAIGSMGITFKNSKIYNNTFINCTGGAWIGPSQSGYTFSNIIVRNNLLYGMNASAASSGVDSAYNAYFNTTGSPSGTNSQTGTSISLNASYVPSAQTDSADTSVLAEYRTDRFGNVGTTRGAIQFGGTPPSPTNPHPGDINSDFLMALNEATKYGACWKNPAAFGDCPAGIAIDYAVRAGTLWAGSATGQYQYNSTNSCPLCWEVKP